MNYKKCPICDLNYIKLDEEKCEICGRRRNDEGFNSLTPIETLNNVKSELLGILAGYDFMGFLHTTELVNFISIYKSGYLKPRKKLVDQQIEFEDNANPEVINKTPSDILNLTRFYYHTKTPTNVSAYREFNQKHPVLLVFSKKIIFEKHVCFCDGTNSAIGICRIRIKCMFSLRKHCYSKLIKCISIFTADKCQFHRFIATACHIAKFFIRSVSSVV